MVWVNLDINDLHGEVWLPIVGYEVEYLVSNMGRVKGLPRIINGYRGARQKLKERIMSQGINSTGYCSVRRTFKFGSAATNLAHRIVAHSFLRNPNNYPEINHKNGIKTDNRVDNLEWCNRSHNLRHAAAVLNINTGTNHFRSKFSEQDVVDIYFSKGSEREIAAKYNVSHSVIGFIKRKKSYKRILHGL